MLSVPVALSCESRSRLGCFDATSRGYLKTRAQENGITGIFASTVLVPHSPLKAATQKSFHSF